MLRSSTDEGSSLSIHTRPKYYLMSGGQFLHQSCLFLTDSRKYAWCDVAERGLGALRKLPAAKGCKLIARSSIQPKQLQEA